MKEQLQKDFDNIIKNLSLSQRDTEIKQFYLDNFINKGFPNRRDENWKFSDLNQIIKKNIGELSFYNDYTSTNKVDTSVFVDGLEHNKIVFINGRIEKIDFDYEKKDQIEIIDKSETINKFNNNNSLSDLNNAFTNKSFKIIVKNGYQLVKPLIIYHITNSDIWSKNINLRLDFELGKDSSLRLIDLYNDTSEKNYLNIFYNFDLKENAVLKNYKVDKLENKNIKYSFNNIDQDNNSVSETFVLSSGSNISKNEINCNLKGEYSSAFENGIFSLKENQQHEIRTTINHLVENTKSYQLIKGVIGKISKAAYKGKIFVDSKAQKTDGYQMSRSLLLDNISKANNKPELEIYADDVKCSHGSTVSKIDQDQIFYFNSRGISKEAANLLLQKAFIAETLDTIHAKDIKDFSIKLLDSLLS